MWSQLSDHRYLSKEVWNQVRYNNRFEVERIGAAGSYWETVDGLPKARVLSSFWLYCDPLDEGFTPHMTVKGEGYWESWITTWMSQNVAPGSRCIDVGANQGYYTMFLADHGCEVIAVEPQPHLAALIEKSAAENLFDIRMDVNVISDVSGVMGMVVPVGHGMNASVAYKPVSPNGFDMIQVESYKLDEYCEGKQYYDFIKVDVEGAEDKLFAGSYEFIQENPECVWLLEWRWDRMEDPQASAEAIFELMDVWYVDFFGGENPLDNPARLAEKQNEDWMLVLRKKK